MNVIQRFFMKTAAKGFRPTMELMYKTLGASSKAFYEKNGEEALPIITKIAEESGVGWAEIAQKMMLVKDMKDVGEMFKMMEQMMEMGMEIIELSDNAIHVKMSKCPFDIEGTSIGLCEAMMSSNKKTLSTLLGQEIEMNIFKSIAAGDEYCEGIFSKK